MIGISGVSKRDTDLLIISGVSERDTDLLILEEFAASHDFGRFVLDALGLNGKDFLYCRGARSVTDSTGESDVEVLFRSHSEETLLIMLENKVNANFQPLQAERYRERGTNYVETRKVDRFLTVLVAPESYFSGDTKGFDHRIDYEHLVDWFDKSELSEGRKYYKKSLLYSAIEKSLTGYQRIEDAVVSDFWMDYWILSHKIAPELGMRKPSGRPSGSSFIYFRPTGLPKGVTLVHKVTHGNFDLQFSNMGNRLGEMSEYFGGAILPEMEIDQAAKSAVIRLRVPKVSVAESVEAQRGSLIQAMQIGKDLLAWAKAHVMGWTS